MARIRRVSVLFGCLTLGAACAMPETEGSTGAEVAHATVRFVAAAHSCGGRVGVVVLDAANGSLLASHRAEEGFLPASNLKVLTAAVALHTLGPDHRLRTELLATGSVENRILRGALVLRGGGDPTFGTEASGDPGLGRLVEAVQNLDVTSIAGDLVGGAYGGVVGDGTWLGDEHFGRGWQWDHLGETFAAPFGGLCCHGNLYSGQRWAPDATPAGASKSKALRPCLDPTRSAAQSLLEALRRAGIAVNHWDAVPTPLEGQLATLFPRPINAKVLFTADSPPVAALVATMLLDSDNLYAEQLWRVAARVASGNGGTDAAERHSMTVLTGLDVDTAGLVMEDGSGLSRRNLVRPVHVAATLLAMHRSPHRTVFAEALPLAGVSGTLRERFPDGPAHGRVRAKTGSIARVVCLSGYLPRADAAAPPLVFSVLWNDFTGPDDAAAAAIDAFVQELAAIAVRT